MSLLFADVPDVLCTSMTLADLARWPKKVFAAVAPSNVKLKLRPGFSIQTIARTS